MNKDYSEYVVKKVLIGFIIFLLSLPFYKLLWSGVQLKIVTKRLEIALIQRDIDNIEKYDTFDPISSNEVKKDRW